MMAVNKLKAMQEERKTKSPSKEPAPAPAPAPATPAAILAANQ